MYHSKALKDGSKNLSVVYIGTGNIKTCEGTNYKGL